MNRLKQFFLSILSLFVLSSCADSSTGPSAPVQSGVWLDVRTAAEFSSGHIPAALHLPFDDISAERPMIQNGTLPKDQTILEYCRSGRRSGIAKQSLESLGYKVINVGGLQDAKAYYQAQSAEAETESGEGTQSPDSSR